MDTAGIELQDLRHSYGAVQTLSGLDLSAPSGTVLGLVGPSGCGKSTLLAILAGLAEPTSGRVAIGQATTAPARLAQCAHMPQRDLLLPWYSALDNASLALRNRGIGRAEARERSTELFSRFGLAGFEGARPAELSGGMRQRVAFLRTLMAEKPVLLLDEPFGALDSITRSEMQEWLARTLAAEPRTVVLVTHDVEEALYLADQVAILSPRPARVIGQLRSPQPRAVDRGAVIADPDFVRLRHDATEMLRSEAVRS